MLLSPWQHPAATLVGLVRRKAPASLSESDFRPKGWVTLGGKAPGCPRLPNSTGLQPLATLDAPELCRQHRTMLLAITETPGRA